MRKSRLNRPSSGFTNLGEQVALKLANKPPFDKGAFPYQDVALVIELRNELVHYKPEWQAVPDPGLDYDIFYAEAAHRFEKALQGKFDFNPMANDFEDPFFPDRCLSYRCARWAFRATTLFVLMFYYEMGLVDDIVSVIDKYTIQDTPND